MKELLKEFINSQVEIVEEQQQRKEVKLIGQQRKIKGLTLWEYNQKSKELIPAKFQKVSVSISALGDSPLDINDVFKVNIKEGCIYFQALNKKNALKKL